MTSSASVRTAWIALIAALMHLLLPSVHAATMPPGFVVDICSTAGTISQDDTTRWQPASSDSHPVAMFECPLCAAGAHMGLTPAPQTVTVTALHLSHVLVRSAPATPSPSPLRVHFLSRAPPLV